MFRLKKYKKGELSQYCTDCLVWGSGESADVHLGWNEDGKNPCSFTSQKSALWHWYRYKATHPEDAKGYSARLERIGKMNKFRSLTAEETEVRVGSVAKDNSYLTLLLYKNARVDMQLLDETVGAENWQRKHESIDRKMYCSVGIRIDKEWIWKQDCGTESNMDKEKGEASDSFKRACTNWGIGRELYTAPPIFIPSFKGTKYDHYAVKHMKVEEGQITELEIINTSKGSGTVFIYPKTAEKKSAFITAEQISALSAELQRTGIPQEMILQEQNIKQLQEMNETMFNYVMSRLEMTPNKER